MLTTEDLKLEKQQFAEILEQARTVYAGMADEVPDLAKFPAIDSLETLKHLVQEQNQKFDHFRSKNRKIFTTLDAVFRPIEILGDVISGATSDIFAPSQTIYTAAMYLINAAKGVSQCYDQIIKLMGQLDVFTDRLGVYLKHDTSPQLRKRISTILALLFKVLIIATGEVRKGRLRRYFLNLVGNNSQVDEVLSDLADAVKDEQGLVGAETHDNVKWLREDAAKAQDSRQDIQKQLETIVAKLERQPSGKDKLDEILQPTIFSEDLQADMERKRAASTGEWIFSETAWRDWRCFEVSCLWICGSQGTGKSYLTSRIVTELKEQAGDPSGDGRSLSVAYFYFSDSDPKTRSVRQALCDVAHQIHDQDSAYARHLNRELRSRDDIKTISSAVRKLFVEPFSHEQRLGDVCIVFDGLDEAYEDELAEFLLYIGDFMTPEGCSKIQILLTGRPLLTEEITGAIGSSALASFRPIILDRERTERDVARYIEDRIYSLRSLAGIKDTLRQEIIDKMAKAVEGLFFVAAYRMAEISRMRNPRDIIDSLEEAPRGAFDLLRQSLEALASTLGKTDARMLREMLLWVTCAKRRFSLKETEALIKTTVGWQPSGTWLENQLRGEYSCFFVLFRADRNTTDNLAQDDIARRAQQLRLGSPQGSPWQSPRSSSAEIHRVSPVRGEVVFDSNKNTTTIDFPHSIITDFLMDDRSSKIRTPAGIPVGFDFGLAKIDVLKLCLRILTDPKLAELRVNVPTLQAYASQNWQEHLRDLDRAAVSPEDKATIGSGLILLLRDQTIILQWSLALEHLQYLFIDESLVCLTEWLADDQVRSNLKAEELKWAKSIGSDHKALLCPVRDLFFKAWLEDQRMEYVDPISCFEILYRVCGVERGMRWSAINSWADIDPDNHTPATEHVRKVLSSAPKSGTGYWSRRVARVYAEVGTFDAMHAAIALYEGAIKLDNNAIDSYIGMGSCYALVGPTDTALEYFLLAEEAMEKNFELRDSNASIDVDLQKLSDCQWDIATCHETIGDVNSAIKYHLRSMANNSADTFHAQVGLIRLFDKNRRYDEFKALMGRMDGQASKVGHNKLVALLIDQCDETAISLAICRLAYITGQVDLVADAYNDAIETVTSPQDSMTELKVRFWAAVAQAMDANFEAARPGFESLIGQSTRPMRSPDLRFFYLFTFQRLAQAYHFQALRAGVDTAAAASWIDRLLALEQAQDTQFGQDTLSVNQAAIRLGHVYRLQGRHGPARDRFAGLISRCLGLLEDSEPDNDMSALEALKNLLFAAGDMAHALALAHSMRAPSAEALARAGLRGPLETLTAAAAAATSDSGTAATPMLGDDDRDAWCDICLQAFLPADTLVRCEDCLALLCRGCLDGVVRKEGAEGRLRARTNCRATHRFWFVPPIDRALERGEVLVGDKAVRIADWKEEVGRGWGVR